MSSGTLFSERRVFRAAGVSALWRPRAFLTALGLAIGAFAVFIVSLGIGDYAISVSGVVSVLFGDGEPLDRTIIWDTRLPRAVGGLVVGAALGMAGAITQSIARNALASPDVLGITEGASAMAVTLIVGSAAISGASYGSGVAPVLVGLGIPLAALVGSLTVTVVIWLLAYRNGVDALRLVLIGIAVSALLQSYIVYLIAAVDLRDVAKARTWLSGSLEGASWEGLMAVAIVLAVALVLCPWMTFRLSVLQLGPTTARVLGGRVQSSQIGLLLVSVALAATCVSAAGPIGFVAFVAPQVALRLARTPAPPLIASAAAGAALVSGADLLARTVLSWELPVGIVTSIIGAPFLIYLVIRANRKATV